MVLKANTSDSFPGAAYVASDPVTAGECCLHATIAGLADAVAAEGVAYTFRGGRLYINGTAANIEDVCSGDEPVVTLVEPDPLIEDGGGTVTGTDFALPQGKLWITDNVAWGAEGVKVEQVAGPWSDTSIDFTVALNGLPQDPAHAWLYVENDCGRANLVGYELEIQAPAK